MKKILLIDPTSGFPKDNVFDLLKTNCINECFRVMPELEGTNSLEQLNLDELEKIIILGSKCSVNDEKPWIEFLTSWLNKSFERNVPTLGICFGHQLIAKIFGGVIESTDKNNSLYKGIRNTKINTNLLWPGHNLNSKELSIIVSHRESIKTLPDSFQKLASSSEVELDGLKHKTKPIWTFQGHIEAEKPFLTRQGLTEEKYYDVSIRTRKLLISFINSYL